MYAQNAKVTRHKIPSIKLRPLAYSQTSIMRLRMKRHIHGPSIGKTKFNFKIDFILLRTSSHFDCFSISTRQRYCIRVTLTQVSRRQKKFPKESGSVLNSPEMSKRVRKCLE